MKLRAIISLCLFGFLNAADSTQPLYQALPDDMLKEIISHVHEPALRGVNKLFRDTVVIHINHPIRLTNQGMDRVVWKQKQSFFRENAKAKKLIMNNFWVFDNYFSANFLNDVVDSAKTVQLKFIYNENDYRRNLWSYLHKKFGYRDPINSFYDDSVKMHAFKVQCVGIRFC